jgi:hypothetical protein
MIFFWGHKFYMRAVFEFSLNPIWNALDIRGRLSSDRGHIKDT